MNYQKVWTDTYKIHSYESDITARATVNSMLQFMQESAWNHAEHLELGYSHLVKKNLAWVMARLSLRINELPEWNSTITLDTFPSGRDKLFAYRDFRIQGGDRKDLAVGTTTWFVIDINRRRPQRTESYFHITDWGDYEHAFHGFAPKIGSCDTPDSTTQRRVYYSHLDVNGHLNNVKYLDFVLDSFSLDFRQRHSLVELDMNFLNEALLGDHVQICTERRQNFYIHTLYRDTNTELCRLRTAWKEH